MSKIIVRCVYAVFFSNSVSFTRDRLSVFLIKRIISYIYLSGILSHVLLLCEFKVMLWLA